MPLPRIRSVPLLRPLLLICRVGSFASISAWAIVTDFGSVGNVHRPVAVHADQDDLNGEPDLNARFLEAFELGDELFGSAFNALDGGGANVGRGQRYTRVPRADLHGRGEWFNHAPIRVTGPNAGGCFECHEQPFEDGAGTAALNVHRDPFRTGLIGQFVERNTPHVFAPGAIQRLAEEMTDGLTADQQRLVDDVCRSGGTRTVTLDTKGVNFGTLSATRVKQLALPGHLQHRRRARRRLPDVGRQPGGSDCAHRPAVPVERERAVPARLQPRRGAQRTGHAGGRGRRRQRRRRLRRRAQRADDRRHDALAVYMAAQPRPTTLIELNKLGLLEPALTSAQVNQINRGAQVFNDDRLRHRATSRS